MSSTYTPLDGLNFTVPAAAQSVVSVGTCGLVISNNLDPIVPVPPQFNVCSSSLVCTYALYCKIPHIWLWVLQATWAQSVVDSCTSGGTVSGRCFGPEDDYFVQCVYNKLIQVKTFLSDTLKQNGRVSELFRVAWMGAFFILYSLFE